MKEIDLCEAALAALRRCLAPVPLGEVRREAAPPPVDCLVRAELPRATVRLILEIRASGEPRQARDAANQLLRLRRVVPDAYPVFVAPYVSSQAAAVCREVGVGYLDAVGNCSLALETVYIERSGHPNPNVSRRELRSLYYPKSERVLRVLLNHPGRVWTLQDLAATAGVSIGLVHKVKERLLGHEWVAQDTAGLRMVAPMEVLDRWAENYRFAQNAASAYYSLDVRGTEDALAAVCAELGIRYALTQFSGAERIAPYVRYHRASAYVSAKHEEVAERLGLRAVSSGANVLLLQPYDEGVYYAARAAGGSMVVSPVQLYLDLLSSPARGAEAAAHLRRQEIEPAWT